MCGDIYTLFHFFSRLSCIPLEFPTLFSLYYTFCVTVTVLTIAQAGLEYPKYAAWYIVLGIIYIGINAPGLPIWRYFFYINCIVQIKLLTLCCPLFKDYNASILFLALFLTATTITAKRN